MPHHRNQGQIERNIEVLMMADALIERETISLTLYNELNTFIHERLDQLHYLPDRSWDEVEKET